jgi:hypothetical protein
MLSTTILAQVKLEYPIGLPNKEQRKAPEQFLHPSGKGQIDKNFLRYRRPTVIAKPALSAQTRAEVQPDTAIMLALARAKQLWGGNPTVSSITPIHNVLGDLVAYDIDLKLDRSNWSDYADIARDWQKVLIEEDKIERTRPSSKEQKSDTKAVEPKHPYASFTISATLDVYPIRAARRGVSNFYASGWVANEIARSVIGPNPVLLQVFLLGPWERSYRFSVDGKQIVVDGQEPWAWYDYQDYYSATTTAIENRKKVVFDALSAPGKTMETLLDSIKTENRKTIQEILAGANSPLNNVFIPGYNTYFEPFEWHYGCAPTSGAMVLNYWENRSWYGKLNSFYCREYDVIEGDLDCHVADLQLQMKYNMGTDDNGFTSASNIGPAMRGYANARGYNFSDGYNWEGTVFSWHWDDMKNVIDIGYPFVWSLDCHPNTTESHTVAAVGYDDVNRDILCYNTFRTSGNSIQRAHYSGGTFDRSFGSAPVPGGPIYYDVKLTSPDGYQTFGSCGSSGTLAGGSNSTISWNNFLAPGHHVDLFYCTDGGWNWTFIASAPDNRSYVWQVPNVSTTQARILIRQYSSSTNLVSSDGSYGDFTIQYVAPPSAPTAVSATNVTMNSFTANWNSVSGATGYLLDVATNSSFTNYVSGYQNLDVGNVTSRSITGLSANTTYYYRVRAYNTGGTSGNSGTITVTTLPNAPSAPTANAATSVTSSSFTANWNSVSGATGYLLDVATNSSFTNYVSGYQNLDVANVTSRSITGLSANTTYYYRVRAHNSSGTSGNSNAISVTTLPNAPSAPTAVSATNVTMNSFTANWNSVSGATGYLLDVATNSSFTNYVSGYQNLDVGNVTSRSITGLSANTTYYYRVRAYNSSGTSGNSDTITATTSSPPVAPPGTPTLASPLNGATEVATNPSLSWNPSSWAASYRLQVCTDAIFTSLAYDQSNITDTSRQVSGLSNKTLYYWRVNATNSAGTSDWSGAWSFTTTLVSPPAQTAWQDDFESYSTDSFPSAWVPDGNATDNATNYITSSTSGQGAKSLQLHGVVAGCWGSIAYRQITISPPFELELMVRNGNESLSGCHPERAGIGLRQGTHWSNPSRSFVEFMGNGNVLSASGDLLQTFSTLSWYTVRVRYEKPTTTEVKMTYWIDGTRRGVETLTADPEEDQMTNLELNVQEGTAWFDNVGISIVTFVQQLAESIPNKFYLLQNYPNPFNPLTTIEFTIPKPSPITLTIFNSLGMDIEVLVKGDLSPGHYRVRWNPHDNPSGVYFYQLRSTYFTETKKLLLVR